MELEDQIHIVKGSLIQDCLNDISQFNMLDVLMLERPPSRKNYYAGFYKDIKKHIGDIEKQFDPHRSPTYRVKALRYCYYKPSMRKILMSWRPRNVETSYKKDTRYMPFNFAYLSTYMRLKPLWRWTATQYKSQLEQLKDLWQYEDDISPDDYMKVDPLVCVGMLEPGYEEEQIDTIKEVFGGYNIIFILYDDEAYKEAIKLDGAHPKITRTIPNLDTFMKNGWTQSQYSSLKISTIKRMKQNPGYNKRRGDVKALEAAREQHRLDNPLTYLGRLLRGRESILRGAMASSNTTNVDKKIEKWIKYCLDKGIDIEDIEALNWFEFRDEFEWIWRSE